MISHGGGGGCLMLNGIKSQFGVTCASTHFVFHTGISPLSNLPNNSNTMQWSQLCRSMLFEAVCRLQLNLLHCSGGRAVHSAVKQMHRKQINIADIAHFPLYFRMHITLCSARQTYRWLQYHGFSPTLASSCHTSGSLSSFLSTFATLRFKSPVLLWQYFILALPTYPGMIVSPLNLTLCISPNMSLLATKVVFK